MCEVGSCCGCISLYRGCLLIGLVSMFVSAIQLFIFSLILYESYDSSVSSSSTLETTMLNDSDPSSFYSFKSRLCPFGFIPLAKTVNDTSFPIAPPEVMIANSSYFGIENSSAYPNSSLANFAVDFSVAYNSSNGTLATTKISCLAPTQGVLWALVVASALYAPVGIVLMIGVKEGLTCCLSTWFFYTVAYNLLALIVALTDGVYTGAADVSSYLVCLATAYCIIVVDSYYEKLLKNERVETASRAAPSLVVVKSTPNSLEGSPQDPPLYSMPPGRPVTAPPGYAPPLEVSELLIPQSPYHHRGDMSPA